LPDGEITEDDARESLRFLLEDWLVDVLTDTKGKLVVLSAVMSMIQRHLLPRRPAYLLTAGQRGGGKTTLCHMVTLASLGRLTSATAWSDSPAERRKSLFALLLTGVAAIVWDNLANGRSPARTSKEASPARPMVIAF